MKPALGVTLGQRQGLSQNYACCEKQGYSIVSSEDIITMKKTQLLLDEVPDKVQPTQ